MRQKIGYAAVLLALVVLLISYAATLIITHEQDFKRLFVGSALTVCPLLYFLPGAIKHESRAFVFLALLAPLYLFYGGIIWIWGYWGWGLWFCAWAVVLEIGAILKNFVPKRLRKGHKTNEQV